MAPGEGLVRSRARGAERSSRSLFIAASPCPDALRTPPTPARPLTSTPMNWSPRSTPSGRRPKRRCTQSSAARLCPARAPPLAYVPPPTATASDVCHLCTLRGPPRHLHWPGSNPWDQIHCPRRHLRPRADALSGRPRGSKLHLTPAPAPAPRFTTLPESGLQSHL